MSAPSRRQNSATRSTAIGGVPSGGFFLGPQGPGSIGAVVRDGAVSRAELIDQGGVRADIPAADVAEFLRRIPMGRAAEPAEIADVIAFLAGPDSRFVTGVVLPIDGGLRAGSGQPPHR